VAEEIAVLPGTETVEVQREDSVGAARRAARKIAETMGFAPQVCEEITLAMTELATNLVKYARGGTLTLTPLADGARVGLEIQSRDDGPGIADVEQALGDRFSTAGTRGTGLGAVNRLMD
jgi:serine/threonine-protein kinase RsbT